MKKSTLTKGVMLLIISSIYDPLGFAALFILEKKEFCKDFVIKADNGTEKPVVLQRKIGKTGLLN